ncbi:MAG: hypothetical protein ACLR8Y_10215 [Alistipes indistinctus]
MLIGRRVTLGYPSGVFVARENPDRYIEIGPDSRIEGYAIVDGDGKPDVKRTNYRQDRTAVLRGLLWVDGAAQVQGIVSGSLAANRFVYYSSEGYYEDMLYDLTLLENPAATYPLWAETAYRRKEADGCAKKRKDGAEPATGVPRSSAAECPLVRVMPVYRSDTGYGSPVRQRERLPPPVPRAFPPRTKPG